MYAVAVFRLLGVSNDLPISNCRSGGGLLGFVVAKVVVSFTAKKIFKKKQRVCLLKRGGVCLNWEYRYLIPFLSFTLFNWR